LATEGIEDGGGKEQGADGGTFEHFEPELRASSRTLK